MTPIQIPLYQVTNVPAMLAARFAAQSDSTRDVHARARSSSKIDLVVLVDVGAAPRRAGRGAVTDDSITVDGVTSGW